MESMAITTFLEHCAEVLEEVHRSRRPADRFIAAMAIVYGLTLVTADDKTLSSSTVPVLRSC